MTNSFGSPITQAKRENFETWEDERDFHHAHVQFKFIEWEHSFLISISSQCSRFLSVSFSISFFLSSSPNCPSEMKGLGISIASHPVAVHSIPIRYPFDNYSICHFTYVLSTRTDGSNEKRRKGSEVQITFDSSSGQKTVVGRDRQTGYLQTGCHGDYQSK